MYLSCILFLLYSTIDSGIMVSMVAFQAVDPGSIPSHRIFNLKKFYNQFRKVNFEANRYRV